MSKLHSFLETNLQNLNPQELLQGSLVILLLVTGVDKFFNFLVDWQLYLPLFIPNFFHITSHMLMRGVGVIEILIALLLAWKPKVGGIIAAFLFVCISVPVFFKGQYFNIVLIDLIFASISLVTAKLSLQK